MAGAKKKSPWGDDSDDDDDDGTKDDDADGSASGGGGGGWGAKKGGAKGGAKANPWGKKKGQDAVVNSDDEDANGSGSARGHSDDDDDDNDGSDRDAGKAAGGFGKGKGGFGKGKAKAKKGSDDDDDDDKSGGDDEGGGFGGFGKKGGAKKKAKGSDDDGDGSDSAKGEGSAGGSDSDGDGDNAFTKKGAKGGKAAGAKKDDSDADERRERAVTRALEAKREAEARKDPIVKLLEEVSVVLEDLTLVENKMARCFPPEYELPAHYARLHRKWVRTVAMVHFADPSTLNKANSLECVKFLEKMLTVTRTMGGGRGGSAGGGGASSGQAAAEAADEEFFDSLMMQVLEVYVDHARGTITSLVTNILARQEEAKVLEDHEGRCITTIPQDLFTVMLQQTDLNKRVGLRGRAMFRFGTLFVDLLTGFQNTTTTFCNSAARRPGAEGVHFGARLLPKQLKDFIAMVNDCGALADSTKQLESTVLALVEDVAGGMRLASGRSLAAADAGSGAAADGAGGAAGAGAGKKGATAAAGKGGKPDPKAKGGAAGGDGKGGASAESPFGADVSPDSPLLLSHTLRRSFAACAAEFATVGSAALDVVAMLAVQRLLPLVERLFLPEGTIASGGPGAGAAMAKLSNELHSLLVEIDEGLEDEARVDLIARTLVAAVVVRYVARLGEAAVKGGGVTAGPALADTITNDAQTLQKALVQFDDLLPPARIKVYLDKLFALQDLLEADHGFISLHFSKICAAFPAPGDVTTVVSNLLMLRTDLSKSQRKELLGDLKLQIELAALDAGAPPPAPAAAPADEDDDGGSGDNDDGSNRSDNGNDSASGSDSDRPKKAKADKGKGGAKAAAAAAAAAATAAVNVSEEFEAAQRVLVRLATLPTAQLPAVPGDDASLGIWGRLKNKLGKGSGKPTAPADGAAAATPAKPAAPAKDDEPAVDLADFLD